MNPPDPSPQKALFAIHKATLLSVTSEKVLERSILRILKEHGAKGHTIFEGGGSGALHHHPSDLPGLSDAFRIIKIEVVFSERKVAEAIAHIILEEHFQDQPGIVTLSEVEIFRPTKF